MATIVTGLAISQVKSFSYALLQRMYDVMTSASENKTSIGHRNALQVATVLTIKMTCSHA